MLLQSAPTTSNGNPHLIGLYPFPNIIYTHSSSPRESRNLWGQGKQRQMGAELRSVLVNFSLNTGTPLPHLTLDLVNPLGLKWARLFRSFVPLLVWPLSCLYEGSVLELYSLTGLPSWLLLNSPPYYTAKTCARHCPFIIFNSTSGHLLCFLTQSWEIFREAVFRFMWRGSLRREGWWNMEWDAFNVITLKYLSRVWMIISQKRKKK